MKLSLFALFVTATLSSVASANWFDGADPAVVYANALPMFSANKHVVAINNQHVEVDRLNKGGDFSLGSKSNYPVQTIDNSLTVMTSTYPSLAELEAAGIIESEVSSASIKKFVVSTYGSSVKSVVAPSFDEVLRQMEQQSLQGLALQQQKRWEQEGLSRAYYAQQGVFTPMQGK